MKYKCLLSISTSLVMITAIAPSAYAKTGDPIAIADGLSLDPIIDARISYEHVDQPASDADALTIRVRSGIELKSDSGFSFLAESEATLGIINDFNDTNISNGIEPFSVVADPENIELNRLQIQYTKKGLGKATLGRQRVNIDDQRFVGSVGWRQNEQTFDAIDIALSPIKNISLNATYANSQRTIFGIDAGPRQAFDGDYIFLGAGIKTGPVNIKAFSYLLDFDPGQPVSNNSTATYGARATAKLPISKSFSLNLEGSYAIQEDYQNNPNDFSVDFISASIGASVLGFGLTAGYENLGADGTGNRVQTPFATLHKFNGWADVFLNTPAAGLEDQYIKLTKKFNILGGLNASVIYHDFNSDVGSINFGDEIDAALTFKVKVVNIGFRYANYNAQNFGVDTERFWFRLGYSF